MPASGFQYACGFPFLRWPAITKSGRCNNIEILFFSFFATRISLNYPAHCQCDFHLACRRSGWSLQRVMTDTEVVGRQFALFPHDRRHRRTIRYAKRDGQGVLFSPDPFPSFTHLLEAPAVSWTARFNGRIIIIIPMVSRWRKGATLEHDRRGNLICLAFYLVIIRRLGFCNQFYTTAFSSFLTLSPVSFCNYTFPFLPFGLYNAPKSSWKFCTSGAVNYPSKILSQSRPLP